MLHDLFHAAATLHSRETAVVGHSGRIGYLQLQVEAVRLASELRRQGARRGDRVAILMANSAEAAVAIWAVLEAGCVFVPLHASSRPALLQPVLRDAEPSCLITGAEFAPALPSLLEACPSVATVIIWGTETPVAARADVRVSTWAISSPEQVADAPQRARDPADPRDLAALIYTSGTTGEAKGAMLSHASMVAGLRAVNAYLGLHSNDTVYSPLPLSSSYGLYQLLIGLALGAKVVLDRSFAFPARSLALAAEESATVFVGVPTIYAWMAGSSSLGDHDLSSVRIMTSAAAALPIEHARRLREKLPRARLYVMYGQTECKRITYLDPEDLDRKPGSVGRGMPFQEHAVVDEEGRAVPAGEIGELVVRGPHLMTGYWRNPEATAWKLRPIAGSPEPWLHTDDLFRVDEDGYLFFVGRRDDILKIGGHKVSPREIEDVLCQIPGVREAAVVSMPDALWGEAARAIIVRDEGHAPSAAAVQAFCRSRMRPYMVPKQVEFVAELPKTESGKVRKRDLR
jgi:amino acid adenylation domain-containing protein